MQAQHVRTRGFVHAFTPNLLCCKFRPANCEQGNELWLAEIDVIFRASVGQASDSMKDSYIPLITVQSAKVFMEVRFSLKIGRSSKILL